MDYLYLSDGGAVDLYENGGPQGSGWGFEGAKQIATGVPGATAANIVFTDLNGDGRSDYILVHDNGALDVWLNIGSYGSSDITWVPYTNVATGLGTANISLADLDGDGRADYLIFDTDGGVSGYLNIRTDNEGKPTWVSQGGAKSIATGVAPYSRIRMADINGMSPVCVFPPQ